MFHSKLKTLGLVAKTKTSVNNSFLQTGMKKSAEVKSGNGAKKYATTGNDFVDQFGKVGEYKAPRQFTDIQNDTAILWAQNPYLTMCFILFLRCITRITQLFNGGKTKSAQRGAGLRYESIMRMMWLHVNHPEVFWNNIRLFIMVGSWKDIFMMLSYDLQYNGWNNKVLDWNNFGKLIMAGLQNENTTNLVKKYLPQIKANSKCTTLESEADNIIAKWLCNQIFGKDSYKEYRKFKTTGNAHQWQQLISRGQHNLVNFDTIAGRALSLMVSSKYLKNNGLELRYQQWIESKPIAKYTGYVYELAAMIKGTNKKYQNDTINAQYRQLLETAGKTNTNLIVVKDTSGSMDSIAYGTKMSSYHIAKSISIFLGNLLNGYFHNHYIDFSSTATLRQIKGSNFVEHWNTESRLQSANTNFLAVCELFIKIFKSGVPESQFPSGIICISDGEFDNHKMYDSTNVEAFRRGLIGAGFSREFVKNFKFCFWDIHNSFYSSKANTKFESHGMENNVFYFSGFDPSVVTFLTGVEGQTFSEPRNAEELFMNAMSQEIMTMIEI